MVKKQTTQQRAKREYKITVADQIFKHLSLWTYSGRVPAISELIFNISDAMAHNIWMTLHSGRNHMFGLQRLAEIEVPVPDYREQLWFDRLQATVGEMLATQQEAEAELELGAMLPSIMDRVFKGEL